MESMTGYAFIENSTEQFSYSIEIKSLNSKFLEIYINLPKVLRTEENNIHNKVKSAFNRGKIELSIDVFDWRGPKPISLNEETIKKYYKELFKIHKDLKIEKPLDLDSILLLEGISQREKTSISEKSLTDIFATMQMVINKTLDMRKKEGKATGTDMLNSVNVLAGGAQAIKKMAKNLGIDKKKQLQERIEALAGSKIDQVRLYTEIAILADKLDINEEIVRLNDHIKKFKLAVKEQGQIGRKLDFLAQEMFREVNTISSKSNSSEISHIVVDLKNHIDKIREQCRNIV